MIIKLINNDEAVIRRICDDIRNRSLEPNVISGPEETIICVIGVLGDARGGLCEHFSTLPGVASVIPVSTPYKLTVRRGKSTRTVRIKNHVVGGGVFSIFAGPCAIESYHQLYETAGIVVSEGADVLRGGAYKPRTRPYDFQGLGVEGLEYLKRVSDTFDIPSVTEVMHPDLVETVGDYTDVFQIGARNMQNFDLLREVGRRRKPVLLKNALSSTLEELLSAAEYILAEGNPDVILCFRGTRTYESPTHVRNDIGLCSLARLRQLTDLPIVVDPSHGTGYWELVIPVAVAVATIADGIIVDVHPDPTQALVDGRQSLKPANFAKLVSLVRAVVHTRGLSLSSDPAIRT
ncbi:MAG: 3-deoxy-7-phosphoheptulonate synthase [Patescibacteria group bacterium]